MDFAKLYNLAIILLCLLPNKIALFKPIARGFCSVTFASLFPTN